MAAVTRPGTAPAGRRPPDHLPAVLAGTVTAAAATAGVAAADRYLLPRVAIGIGGDVGIGGSVALGRSVPLAFAGAAAGGLLVGGSALWRAALAAGIGLGGDVGMRFGLPAFAPMG